MRFRNSKDWHAVHAREQFVSKGFGKTTLEDFMVSLILQKCRFFRIIRLR